MKKVIMMLVMLVIIISATEKGATGHIKRIYTASDNIVYFWIEKDGITYPSNDHYFKFDPSTSWGKTRFALLLSCANSGQEVFVRSEDYTAGNTSAAIKAGYITATYR